MTDMSEEYLVVHRNDGTTDLYLTGPGKGFRRFDRDGGLTDTVLGYSEAIDGWTRMCFRSDLAEAMHEAGMLAPCPVCGGHALRCGPPDGDPTEGTSRIECLYCGCSEKGLTIIDARMRWNSGYGRRLNEIFEENTLERMERGL